MLKGFNENGELENVKVKNGAVCVTNQDESSGGGVITGEVKINNTTKEAVPVNAVNMPTEIKVNNGETEAIPVSESTLKDVQVEEGAMLIKVVNASGSSGGDDLNKYFNLFITDNDKTLLKQLPPIDTFGLTDASNLFTNYTMIGSIPEIDTSNVLNMTSMFQACSSLRTIPKLNTSKVTNMSMMFYGCNYLKTIPELDTSKVTDMSMMFNSCTCLETIPELDTSSVTNMSSMFNQCGNLTTVSELDTSSATDMADMFLYCNNLSDDSLNNILAMCIKSKVAEENKNLTYIGLTMDLKTRCQSLSNYTNFTEAGWTTD